MWFPDQHPHQYQLRINDQYSVHIISISTWAHWTPSGPSVDAGWVCWIFLCRLRLFMSVHCISLHDIACACCHWPDSCEFKCVFKALLHLRALVIDQIRIKPNDFFRVFARFLGQNLAMCFPWRLWTSTRPEGRGDRLCNLQLNDVTRVMIHPGLSMILDAITGILT
jgi:hypothetical protein